MPSALLLAGAAQLHAEGGVATAMVKGLLATPAAKQKLGVGTRIMCSQPLQAIPHLVYHRDLYQTSKQTEK